MSYSDVVEGLHERFATVDGLAQYGPDGDASNLLAYQPTAVHHTPLLYTLLDSFETVNVGQVRGMRYRSLHRLVLDWQDSAACEELLRSFVDTIPAAVIADRHLGGRIGNGLAEISEGQAGWATISGTEYRVLDFYSDVLVK